jgi:peptidoglycan hydrolase-like protein with peptidoglycan-binding domain
VRVVDVDPVLIEYFPQYRGYKYFVANDEIVVVDNSRKIVSTLPVGSSGGSVGRAHGGGTGRVAGGGGAIDLSPDQIRQIQMALIQQGYDIGEPDGRLGPRTKQALIAFQRKQGIQTTGRLDERTMMALGVSGTTGQQSSPGANQPATTGQGPAGAQPPANQNMGAGEQGNQGANQSGTTGQAGDAQRQPPDQNAGAGQRNNQDQPSTTGQGQGGERMQQQAPPNRGGAGGADGQSNRPANQGSRPDAGR